MKKYLLHCLLAATVTFTFIATINWVIDPYWIYGAPEIKNFNAHKPVAYDNQRIFETTNILNNPSQALILGTSREDMGISTQHPIFHGISVFNAAITSQPFVESKEILRSMSNQGHFPSLIIFGLLFEKSNAFSVLPKDYTPNNFDKINQYKLLLSSSTLQASVKTLQSNLIDAPIQTFQKDGFRTSIPTSQLLLGQHEAFTKSEKHYLLDSHFPLPLCKNAFVADTQNDKLIATPMQELRAAIIIAYHHKTDMRLFIGPSHARQWETIHASGLWGQFEDWKRMVVKMVEEEALKASAAPFQVWDFSGYNTITEEDVPAVKDINKRMRYYYESSHYTPTTGDLVLNRIFNLNSIEHPPLNDFGVLLNSHSINNHLANIRLAREHYTQTHPQDVAEVEAMAQDIAKHKNCQRAK